MDALNFFREFCTSTNEDNVWEDDPQKRNYFLIYSQDEPSYTELVNKHIIHDIIVNAGLTAQHEYFRVDTVGWEGRYKEIDKAEARECELNRHFWDLKIAVEHENSKKDWMDEVSKLVHLRCPLKVIIAYNYCDMRGNEELQKLEFISKWMQRLSAFDSYAKEEYLIIFGNGRAKSRSYEPYNCFDYRGYLFDYKKNCFERINAE